MRYATMLLGYLTLFVSFFSFALAEGMATDRYALPRDKSALEACRELVLTIRPGQIRNVQTQQMTEQMHYRFEIENAQGELWSVVCDAATRKILSITNSE